MADPAEISLLGYESHFPAVAGSSSLCVQYFSLKKKNVLSQSAKLVCFDAFNCFNVFLFYYGFPFISVKENRRRCVEVF